MTVSTAIRRPAAATPPPRAPLRAAIARVIFEHAVARVSVRVSYPDGAYFATLDRPLAPGGTVAIQAITARTLHWRERFQGQRPRIHTQGFDETFQMTREAA